MAVYSESLIEFQVENKKLFLIGDIDNDMLTNFCLMRAKGIQERTELWIHSNGGSLWSFLGLRDSIAIERNIEKIIGYGVIYSAAAYLFISLPERQLKYMTPNCELMLHKATIVSVGEHEFEHKNTYKTIERDNKIMESLFKKAILNKSKQQQKKLLDKWRQGEDIYFTAEECLELNIIDGIVDSVSEI